MIILDENFPDAAKETMRSWHIQARHIGTEIGRSGMKDAEIIRMLHSLRRPTLFTLDLDFYKRRLCHSKYCLAYLEVSRGETAKYTRAFLQHREFNTEAKRMGNVVRVNSLGLRVLRLNNDEPVEIGW